MSAKTKPPKVLVVKVPSPRSGKGKRFGGSESDTFNTILADQTLRSLWVAHSDSAALDEQYQAALTAMMGIGPRDEIEGMLAAQMIGLHNAAMECMRRAMIQEQTFEGRRDSLNQATKLTRSYATLMEALDRHRGKGQQKVVVEHVHVHQGGQAIVGAVQGGGVSSNLKGQPHAPAIIHEPGQALPSEIETIREAVPSPGG